jgi:hypothetical protein
LIEHAVGTLIGQRVFGIALGYEDLNDHDELRHDPLMAVLAGKLEARREDCAPVAGKSTRNRRELSRGEPSRYHKIAYDGAAIEALPVTLFLEAHTRPPEQIIFDLDATDDPLHGHQEGRFFHGYYDCYCYLPLYVFCGEHLLAAKLRPADIDGAAGAQDIIRRIVEHIRSSWSQVNIVLRGDSGFCREPLMAWCESNGVDYLFGLARNARLCRIIGAQLHEARLQFEATGAPARIFSEFEYRTKKSWSRSRRVIAKAEHLEKGSNPRFVVTSIRAEQFDAKTLYEQEYCARGEMENRIKEQQLYLFADRVSAATMRANQLRLYEAAVAYLLIHALRRLGLKDTPLAQAQAPTIRQKLLKIGTQIRVTTRRVWLSWSQAYPYQELFRKVYENLQALAIPRPTPVPIRC